MLMPLKFLQYIDAISKALGPTTLRESMSFANSCQIGLRTISRNQQEPRRILASRCTASGERSAWKTCPSSPLDGHSRNQSFHNNGAETAEKHGFLALSQREFDAIAIPEIGPNPALFGMLLAIRWREIRWFEQKRSLLLEKPTMQRLR
jgi:hypothetical protein